MVTSIHYVKLKFPINLIHFLRASKIWLILLGGLKNSIKKFLNTSYFKKEIPKSQSVENYDLRKFKFEITTLRKDIHQSGRQTDVIFTTDWKQDALRRDFTINSIYYDHNNYIDPFNVNADLKKHRVGEFITTVPCLYDDKYKLNPSKRLIFSILVILIVIFLNKNLFTLF